LFVDDVYENLEETPKQILYDLVTVEKVKDCYFLLLTIKGEKNEQQWTK